MRRLPSLNAVRAFEAAARHDSFTLAGDELCVTPGAISRQVRALEDYLGSPLFERGANGLSLTQCGREFLQSAGPALDMISDATQNAMERAGKHIVRVSILPSIAAHWLAACLDDFHTEHPEIELQLLPTVDVVDLSSGKADMAIRFGAGGWQNVRYRKLMDELLFPVCSPRLLADGPRIMSPDDLCIYPMLHCSRRDLWGEWIRESRAKKLSLSQGIQLNDYNVALEMALSGKGIAMGRKALVHRYLEEGQLVCPWPLSVQSMYGYFAVFPTHCEHDLNTKSVLDWLNMEAKSLTGKDFRLERHTVSAFLSC